MRSAMRSNIRYTISSIIALLVILTIFFFICLEGFLRRGEAAVSRAEVEAAGADASFTGKKAGVDIIRVAGAEDFMAQDPFSQFTVEPLNATPTGLMWWATVSTSTPGHQRIVGNDRLQ